MGTNSFSLGELQQSAVYEVANIGLGHAITALSTMTGRSFNMSIPNIDSVPIETVTNLIGNPEAICLAVLMPVEGDVEGNMAFIFPWASAQGLWQMLLGQQPNEPSEVGELEASAMLEIGNIINSNFLNAIADMTNLNLCATPPMVSVEMAASIVSSVVAESELKEAIALAIETKIFAEGTDVNGIFLFIPTIEGLNLLFSRLGIAEAA